VRPLPPPPPLHCLALLRCLALWLWLVQLRPAAGLSCWLRTYSGPALFGRPVDHAPFLVSFLLRYFPKYELDW
jgi:hypothetical protein